MNYINYNQASIINGCDYWKIYSKIRYKLFSKLADDLKCIPYAIIKGEPLAYFAYNSFGRRISGDIDILIERTSLQRIKNILLNNGYSYAISNLTRNDELLSMAFSHQLIPYQKIVNGFAIDVDVNYDVFWGEYTGKKVDIDKFLSDTIEMEIYGVKVKTLPPLKAMVQLILHHYKDMNSIFLLATRKSIKHEMFKDVYYLLKNNLEAISLDKLYNISAEYEIIPYVFYVLYYTGQIFDDDVLREYIEAFRTPEGERLLNLYGLCEKERKEWKCDFKTRLESENLLDLIKDDLTERDKEKIAINRRVFLGESE